MLRSRAIWGTLAGLAFVLILVVSACVTLTPDDVDRGPTPTAVPHATSTLRPTFTPAGAGSAGCEACHSDKEKLKAVAAAEKGPGEVACKG